MVKIKKILNYPQMIKIKWKKVLKYDPDYTIDQVILSRFDRENNSCNLLLLNDPLTKFHNNGEFYTFRINQCGQGKIPLYMPKHPIYFYNQTDDDLESREFESNESNESNESEKLKS